MTREQAIVKYETGLLYYAPKKKADSNAIQESFQASKRTLGQKKKKRGPSRHNEMETAAISAGVVIVKPKGGETYTTYS